LRFRVNAMRLRNWRDLEMNVASQRPRLVILPLSM
jgi:hypothetical protein